ncbi:MAG: FHA domain-containing protein [Myxococcota bacterium]
MAHTYFLLKVTGEADRLVVWDTRTMSVGRSPDNAVVVAESDVSRKHAIFMKEGDRCEVGDHQTGNGTFVNGQRVAGTCSIRNGDVIAVGKAEFHFCEGDEHPAKRGMKLEYASHLMTAGMMPESSNPNATMVGIMDTGAGDDDDFVIEHNDGTGSDLFSEDPLELDQVAAPAAPVRDLDFDFADAPPAAATAPPPAAPAPAPAQAAPPAAPATDPNEQSQSDPVERMRRLKGLHAEGLITDEEFQAKRAEILQGV